VTVFPIRTGDELIAATTTGATMWPDVPDTNWWMDSELDGYWTHVATGPTGNDFAADIPHTPLPDDGAGFDDHHIYPLGGRGR